MTTLITRFAAIATAFAVLGCSDERPPAPASPSPAVRSPTEAAVPSVIDELANKNNAPTIDKNRRGIEFPPGYDWLEQERVIEAWKTLHQQAAELLPDLVAHANEERYSVTFEINERWYNSSVGMQCWSVFRSTVECYELAPDLFRYCRLRFVPEPPELHAWWQARKDKSLIGLQLEMLDEYQAALAEAKKRNTETPTPEFYELVAAKLAAIQTQIRNSGKPVIRMAFLEMYSFRNYPIGADDNEQ